MGRTQARAHPPDRPAGRFRGHPAATPGGLWLFAVDATWAQVTWRTLGAGKMVLEAHGPDGVAARVAVATDGGPGSVVVPDLRPGTRYRLAATGDGLPPDGVRTSFTTLSPPPGEVVARFATVSDLHLGEHSFGYFGTMRERPAPDVLHPVRALDAALDEIATWRADLLVVKGDITHDGRVDEWDTFGALVSAHQLRFEATVGNHDNREHERPPRTPAQTAWWVVRGGLLRAFVDRGVEKGEAVGPYEGLAGIGYEPSWPVHSHLLPGIRVVLADTTRKGRHLGGLSGVADEVVDLAADARRDGLPVFLGVHHPPMRWSVPYFWPPGVPASESGDFFARLHRANPAALLSAGHTHRHRRYTRSGVLCTEVGSPKDFPGTWAAYTVYEGGITQVVRRVGRPDVLRWTDRSGRAAGGLWSAWSPGRLAWRCFSYPWSR